MLVPPHGVICGLLCSYSGLLVKSIRNAKSDRCMFADKGTRYFFVTYRVA